MTGRTIASLVPGPRAFMSYFTTLWESLPHELIGLLSGADDTRRTVPLDHQLTDFG